MILIRFSGDICIKARKTRERFTRQLRRNVKEALAAHDIECHIDYKWSRFVLSTDDDERALPIAQRIFGVQSASIVEKRNLETLEEIVQAGTEIFTPLVADRRFAVRARRGGDASRIPFRSMDIERDLGTALLPGASEVDLSHPEVTASVEVHPGRAFFFSSKGDGPGGLPLKVEGRAMALVSGGFDSAVAAWMMLKRGVGLDYLFFNLGGYAHHQGVTRVMKVVADDWSYGYRPRLYSVDLRPCVLQLQERVTPRYWQVVLKRLMMRGANRLTRRLRQPALVTGEAMGQVSSQTLHNLAVISAASQLPILRPLLGFNKDEIVQLARHIGTYELSAAVDEYCAILSRKVATRAGFRTIDEEEAKLDPHLWETAVDATSAVDLRSAGADVLYRQDLEVDEVPEGTVVLDFRPRRRYDAWHLPGALWMDFVQAQKAYPSFDRGQSYLLCCEVGLKSAHLAELMHGEGFTVHNLRGGVNRLEPSR